MLKRYLLIAGIVSVFSLGNLATASIFVTDLVDGANPLPIDGNQAWPGQLGDDFSLQSNISITSIGVFDDDGDGTIGDLVWQLFNVNTGALVHSQVVLATGLRPVGGTDIEDNYVWADLVMPLLLTGSTTYSAVAYGFDDVDKNFNTNLDEPNLDVVFSSDGIVSAGGRYSNGPSATLPGIGPSNINAASDTPYNFGAATFEYAAVPEAASVAIWSLLAAIGALVGKARTRK